MSALAELIARVEGLTEPNGETGRNVLLACGWRKTLVGHFYGPLYYWSSPDAKTSFKDDDFRLHDPTASIDAVVALIERELPGWIRSITTGCGKTVAHVRDKSILCEDKIEGSGFSSIEACALLAAFLRALEARAG